MPDREAYLDPSPKAAALRAQYQAHIAAILKLADVPDAESRAARILSLEIRIAQAHAPDSDAADVFKQNNPWKRADFDAKAPGMDWKAYFKAAGVAEQPEFVVWQPSAVTGTSALVGSEELAVWKDYLKFHLIEHYASVLPKRVARRRFCVLRHDPVGEEQMPDRSEPVSSPRTRRWARRSASSTRNVISRPKRKAKAQAMVADLITAYRARISNLAWMSPADEREGSGQAGRASHRRRLSRHVDRLFDARRGARRRLRQYASRRSLQSLA